jgi:Paraquat-inducible protein A
MKIHAMAPVLLLGIITLVIGHFISVQIVEDSKEVARIKLASTEPLLMVNRLMNVNEWNPISKAAQKAAMDKHNEIITQANESQERIDRHAVIIVWLAVGMVVFTILLYLKSTYLSASVALSLAFSALLFLRIGVDAPSMEIQVYSENLKIPVKISGAHVYEYLKEGSYTKYLPFTEFIKNKEVGFDQVFYGKIYYQYQTKSILESIALLFKAKNHVVAWALLLFSVILPLLKLLLNVWMLLWPRFGQKKAYAAVVYFLSKWSMADVFVVAMFLTYLSLQNMGQQGVTVESQVSIGFYFFLAYVILSIASSMLTQNWARK